MKSKVFGLIAALLLGAPAIAPAATVSGISCSSAGGEPLCVTSILGLDVSGTLYDITFGRGVANTVYPTPLPFLNDSTAATSAAQAMISVARGAGFEGACDTTNSSPCYTNPSLYFGSGYIDANIAFNFTVVIDGDFGATNRFWAVFSPASVPESGTLALLGLGLAGLGLSRRRNAV